jgi:hypothetical protein
MDSTATTCARHPEVETRLSCTQCGTPICPRCAVDAPVGQKCPDCARQERGARALGKPRQYRRAVAAGLGVAAVGALLLVVVYRGGFLTLIASGAVGYGVATAVRWGAENNAAAPFRRLSHVLSGATVVVGLLLAQGSASLAVFGQPFALLAIAVAVYGSHLRFQR